MDPGEVPAWDTAAVAGPVATMATTKDSAPAVTSDLIDGTAAPYPCRSRPRVLEGGTGFGVAIPGPPGSPLSRADGWLKITVRLSILPSLTLKGLDMTSSSGRFVVS
jgi:hypothetical protein